MSLRHFFRSRIRSSLPDAFSPLDERRAWSALAKRSFAQPLRSSRRPAADSLRLQRVWSLPLAERHHRAGAFLGCGADGAATTGKDRLLLAAGKAPMGRSTTQESRSSSQSPGSGDHDRSPAVGRPCGASEMLLGHCSTVSPLRGVCGLALLNASGRGLLGFAAPCSRHLGC